MTALDEHPTDLPLAFPDAEVISTAAAGSQEWHDTRRAGVGGSDVAEILGFLPKYSSALKVYLDKRGELPPQRRSASLEEAAEFGRLMEPLIREQWAKRTGHRYVLAPGTLARRDAPWMRVNLDGIAIEGREAESQYGVLECKNRSEYQLEDWNEDIPDPVAVQTMWGMAVTGFTFGHAAAVIGGNKLRTYRIPRDESAISDLVELMAEFWHNTGAGIRPPLDGSEATAELLSQMYGVDPTKSAVASRDVVQALLDRDRKLREQKKEIEEGLRAVKNRLHDLAQDAVEVYPEGEATDVALFTLKATGTFAPKRFAEAHPEEAAACTREMPQLDRQMVATKYPELYDRFRARVVRVPSTKKTKRSPR